MLREAGGFGVGVGSGSRIVLVVILQRECVFGIDDVVEIGDGLIGDEIRSAGRERVLGKIDRGSEAAGRWDQELAVRQFVVEEAVSHGIDVAGGSAYSGENSSGSGEIAVDERGYGGRTTITGETGR